MGDDEPIKKDEVKQSNEHEKRAAEKTETQEMPFSTFLEQIPPDTTVKIVDFAATTGQYLSKPDLLLYCENEKCKGPRLFHCDDSLLAHSSWGNSFLEFICRNCGKQLYRFAILYRTGTLPIGFAMKYGQFPAFGPHTPPRLIRLVEPDRELFLQGRRAENRGLGIGAFAYYRRVVENQRNRIIEQIAKVAKVVGSAPEADALFAAALNQFQFSKSIEMVMDLIPQTLLINGENPLTLLHSALSKGLHDPEMTDKHCLELAQSIRTVLTELAERASLAMKEDKEIQEALKVLKAVPRGAKSATPTDGR